MLADLQNRICKAQIVVAEYRLHADLYELGIGARERSHHAKVEPDDAPVPHADIARMRVCVEKPVLGKLLDVVIYKLRADLLHVISLLLHRGLIRKLKAADVFHDQNVLCRKLVVHTRAVDILYALNILAHTADVIGLALEIHLLLRDGPHLVNGIAEIHDVIDLLELNNIQCTFKKPYVALHDRIYLRAPDFHSDVRSVEQHGLVHLCDRRCAQRVRHDLPEHSVPRLPVFLAYYLAYLSGN